MEGYQCNVSSEWPILRINNSSEKNAALFLPQASAKICENFWRGIKFIGFQTQKRSLIRSPVVTIEHLVSKLIPTATHDITTIQYQNEFTCQFYTNLTNQRWSHFYCWSLNVPKFSPSSLEWQQITTKV